MLQANKDKMSSSEDDFTALSEGSSEDDFAALSEGSSEDNLTSLSEHSSEDDFTRLSELTVGKNKCRVRVRVSRLWESFNPKNDISFGLDCLLIDDEGETMQARVLPDDIDQFEEQLTEGKVYALSDFTVGDTRESYMTCSNEFTIYFGRQTVVNEIEGDIDSIPLHSFEFIDFKNLRSRCDDNSVLTDVLGHIVYVGDLQEVEKKSRTIEICNVTIQNLSGRKLGVTLYGDIACGFAEDMLKKGQKGSGVAVFAGMRVESSHSVCSTTCSKYYLDLEIPEVQEFCANLHIQLENPIPEKSEAQKLAESWRTIEQIKRLDPKDYDEDTTFLCRVSLIDIDCTSGWCYLGCDTCQKSMGRAPRKYRCSRCGPIKRPINWYKLKTTVKDPTGTMTLMIFCEVAEELVGVSAEELVDEIEDDEEWYTLPEEIEDLLGSTRTFQVFDKHLSGSFSVYAIMDDDIVPVPAATTSQCKEESVPEGSSEDNLTSLSEHSSEDDFTRLSELTVGKNKCRVRVRVSRLWESFNPKNDISFGLDCLLIDDEGETMQARVLPDDIDQFEEQLTEGKVYALSDFTVGDTRESYMTCSNEFTIYFGRQTVVNEIEGDIDSIPLHSFEFIDFKNLRSRCDDNSVLTDVLGHIVYVGDLQEVEKKSRTIEICNVTIQNLSGRKLGVTLYGDIACGFAEDMLKKGQKGSVVAVFAGMRVESSHSVCSTTCSKYYLDLEIPEVQEFCANLHIQLENPIPEKSEAQKLAESWRTIEQIKRLDPKDYDEDTTFLCRVSLIDIDCTSGWCYLGCDTCQKSMGRAPRKYRCSRCGPIKRPINWYKLKTTVKDATGTMTLMIFCEVAEELVGVSAEELVDEIEDDEEWYTLPEEIEDLLGSTRTFQVFDKHLSGSFSVYAIMDDDIVPVPAATTSQCKEESVPEGSVNAAFPSPATTLCKVEPVLEDSVGMAAPAPTMTPCKEEPFSMVVPAPTTKHECKEEPFVEHSVNIAVPLPTTTQCKEEEPVLRAALSREKQG